MVEDIRNYSETPMERVPYTPEAEENKLISLAYDLAKQQLEDGTASAQVITHFLKLGTAYARLEKTKLEKEIALLEAKKADIESSKRVEELYADALEAMRSYSSRSDQGG